MPASAAASSIDVGAERRPAAILISISQTLAALRKTSFPPSSIAVRASSSS
jgi:hypothetical protein